MPSKTYLKFLGDIEELKWFYDHCIPMLKDFQCFYLSCSMRKKHLTKEQRELVQHKEMFNAQVIYKNEFEELVRNIKCCEVDIECYFKSETAEWINNAVMIYWNINPVDSLKVLNNNIDRLQEIKTDLLYSALSKNEEAMKNAWNQVQHSSFICKKLYARNMAEKYWIDFDVDVDKEELYLNYAEMHNFLANKLGEGNFVEVETKGGLHILAKKSIINFNPIIIVDKLSVIFTSAKEVNTNHNGMIPLPGTLQAGFLVKVLNKNKFLKENSIK
jgi:hypothetical protein